ncbi:MAG: UDP-N-acetylmuramoyl-tripeptide--D-alanyl-D-alanine ligase [Paracoccaceae bacterium]|nr:UDP-N-acetylmuramoyl-tripeptide--D-alanyl-D-alanine ligase [Paracoccaceae bacterium]
MTPLWTSAEAEAATGGRSTERWTASGVSIDSRSLPRKALFVAIRDQRDGHDFVADAFAKGAAAAVVSRRPPGLPEPPGGQPLLVVEETLEALEALARAARQRFRGRVIGVTGSVGKTGTKDMLKVALAPQGRVHASESSFNNKFGVPLTLARMPRETDHAVVEIGMNRPGEISPLAGLSRLDVALVTTVVPVHMAAFSGIADIARAKAEIFSGLRPSGTAVINRDLDPELVGILAAAARRVGARIVTFGRSDRAEYRLTSVEADGTSTVIGASCGRTRFEFRLGLPAPHLALNAVAVLAAVDAVGGDPSRAAAELAAWQVPTGRGNRFRVYPSVRGGREDGPWIEVIDESYNANPTSMGAALELLAIAEPAPGGEGRRSGRRVAFLGDMLELGPNEAEQHAALAQHPALDRIDRIHTAGSLMRNLHDALPDDRRGVWVPTSDRLVDQVDRLVRAGDVVMAKGSLGARMGLIVTALRGLDARDRKDHAHGSGGMTAGPVASCPVSGTG